MELSTLLPYAISAVSSIIPIAIAYGRVSQRFVTLEKEVSQLKGDMATKLDGKDLKITVLELEKKLDAVTSEVHSLNKTLQTFMNANQK